MSITCAIWWPCVPAARHFWNVCHQDIKNKAIRFLFPTEAKMQIHYLAAFLTFKDTDITINNVSQGSRRVWAKRVWDLSHKKYAWVIHQASYCANHTMYIITRSFHIIPGPWKDLPSLNSNWKLYLTKKGTPKKQNTMYSYIISICFYFEPPPHQFHLRRFLWWFLICMH